MTETAPVHTPPRRAALRRAALIVAAGTGTRAGGGIPKQFRSYRGKPLAQHCMEVFQENRSFDRFLLLVASEHIEIARKLFADSGFEIVTGGTRRQDTVALGLEHLAATGGADRVFIHDAARPGLMVQIIERLDAALDSDAGAVPVLPVIDSVAMGGARLGESIDRSKLLRVQTPQAFRFDDILNAHRLWPNENEATDDARILQSAGGSVATVKGDEALAKITFAADFKDPLDTGGKESMDREFRTGSGFDVHRLIAGEELWLGGLRIEHDKGLSGHSDADVALHALTDAILGAACAGDIGDHFPPSDPQWSGAKSARFLRHAKELANQSGGKIMHVDVTIVCEAPRIAAHKQAMREKIAEILDIEPAKVSVKATTTEGTGPEGRGEAISAQALATLMFES